MHCVDLFKHQPVYGDFAYFRLHSVTGYRYCCTDEDLEQLLDWCQRFDEAYCLFNNISMWDSALKMKQLVDDRSGISSRP